MTFHLNEWLSLDSFIQFKGKVIKNQDFSKNKDLQKFTTIVVGIGNINSICISKFTNVIIFITNFKYKQPVGKGRCYLCTTDFFTNI